jgi:hypothetical protein
MRGQSDAGGHRARSGAAAAACLTALLAAVPAHADLRVDGKWRQGPLREDFTVQQWLNGCGPPPQSSTVGGGELVSLRLEGDELAIVGGGRVYRTNQCYDPMPTLSRESHSRDANGKTWRTRCSTPANDPRKALLNTLIVATSDTHVDVIETGRYEVVIETGRCMADVKRTRAFDLVSDDAPKPSVTAESPAATTPKEPRAPTCSVPGEPSRLEVRPSQKLLRTGDSFQFRAAVLDQSGCATRTQTSWKLAPGSEGKGIAVDATGNVTVAADAPESKVELIATAAGKDARVTVEITQPAHYDELLARSGLNASGENDAASTVSIGTQSIGAGAGRVEDTGRTRKLTFVAIIGSILVVLAAVGVVLLRRTRRAKTLELEAEERHDERVRAVLERRRTRADRHAAQLRAHEESVAAARASAESAESPAPAKDVACPRCGREFPPPTAFCPHDGSALVAASKAAAMALSSGAAMAQVPPAKRGKICPTCGDRFDGGADYCGKDGTQLVLLN